MNLGYQVKGQRTMPKSRERQIQSSWQPFRASGWFRPLFPLVDTARHYVLDTGTI